MDTKFTAFVPMKAHSERVPNKNIRSFNGSPLYSRIIQTLDKVEYIDEILIDTDSDVILKDAPKYSDKVKVIKRIPELEGDFAPFLDILKYDMEQSKNNHYIQTHSTNPLLSAETIKSAIEYFFKSDHDSVFGASLVRSRLYDKDLKPMNFSMQDRLLRTQDLPTIWEENSTLYIFNDDSFFGNNEHRLGKNCGAFEIPEIEAQDIDEEIDFVIAELLDQKLNS